MRKRVCDATLDGICGHINSNELQIMKWLFDNSGFDSTNCGPFERTQNGIRDKFHFHISEISHCLIILNRFGLVESKIIRIIGSANRRKVFTLTKNGVEVLNKMMGWIKKEGL